MGMASAAGERLGSALDAGIVLAVPERTSAGVLDPRWTVLPADHPLPTERNIAGALAVKSFVESCGPDQTLLALVSGGGSAHLTLPWPGLSLDDLRATTRAMQDAGWDIHRINVVRKHLEQLKGGRLAAMCPSRRIMVLLLSDVLGDDPATIASGPFFADRHTWTDVHRTLLQGRVGRIPDAVTDLIRLGMAGRVPETPKPGDPRVERAVHRIIGNNADVVGAVARRAADLGYSTRRLEQSVKGEACEASRAFVRAILELPRDAPAALVAGGEPTVRTRGSSGPGGPGQEFVLHVLAALGNARRVALAAVATDGIDGNSDAAGALIGPDWSDRARAADADLHAALARHQSTLFLDAIGSTLRTGPSGTNLNHVFVALTYPGPAPGVRFWSWLPRGWRGGWRGRARRSSPR
jgi:glycerate-2-kinase